MPEERKIRLFPRDIVTNPMGNEHVIYAYGDLAEEKFHFMDERLAQKLLKIFSGSENRGTRIEIYRQPKPEELKGLRKLADELQAELEVQIRTDDEYQTERNAEMGRRKRR